MAGTSRSFREVFTRICGRENWLIEIFQGGKRIKGELDNEGNFAPQVGIGIQERRFMFTEGYAGEWLNIDRASSRSNQRAGGRSELSNAALLRS